MEPPRHLNSPLKPRMSWKELVAISFVNTLIILISPLWIPLALITLVYFKIRKRFPRRKALTKAELITAFKQSADPELRRRMAMGVRDEHGFGLIDPVCLELELAWAFSEAKRRAEEEVGGPYQRGDCRKIWRIMKKILRADFDILWYTPAEMNPRSSFY